MIFIILVLIGIIGYFKTNDKFNDNRDQRIIQCLNNAGIPVKTLAYITVAADRKTELTFTSTTAAILLKYTAVTLRLLRQRPTARLPC